MNLGQAVALVLAAGAVLIAAATVLASAADAIGDRTRIGKAWIGTVLVATATSLPELTVDVTAVRMHAADLAAGDLFGSSMANMLLLALVGLLARRRDDRGGRRLDHVRLAALAIALNALAAAFVLLRPRHSVLGIAPQSLLLVVVYGAGARALFRRDRPELVTPAMDRGGLSLRAAVVRFIAAALVILLAAPHFVRAAEEVAERSGLGSTFVGTFLVGVATSLPELVTSVAAARIGSFDLAIGNLFGSNAFNMVVFFAMDLAGPEPIFAELDPSHVVSASWATVLMATALAAVVAPPGRARPARLLGVLVVVAYVAGAGMLFLARR